VIAQYLPPTVLPKSQHNLSPLISPDPQRKISPNLALLAGLLAHHPLSKACHHRPDAATSEGHAECLLLRPRWTRSTLNVIHDQDKDGIQTKTPVTPTVPIVGRAWIRGQRLHRHDMSSPSTYRHVRFRGLKTCRRLIFLPGECRQFPSVHPDRPNVHSSVQDVARRRPKAHSQRTECCRALPTAWPTPVEALLSLGSASLWHQGFGGAPCAA
jgi:hypothetical protein